MQIGTNLTGYVESLTEFPFSDLFKKSRPWISGDAATWDNGKPLDLDYNGWVRSLQAGQVARVVLIAGMPTPPPPILVGDWTVTWEGTGTIQFAGLDVKYQGARKAIVTYSGGDAFMHLVAVTPSDYVRDIHVALPKMFEGHKITKQFEAETRPFSALRFMDMQFTNGSAQRLWANRTRPETARWNNTSVPLEELCGLCNHLDSDGWFCVPHLADDEYVRNMAETIADNLDLGQSKVYVEYSNEVWNNIMPQSKWASQQGAALKLGANDFDNAILWNALRAVQCFRIFEQVIPKESLVRVLGSFIDVPYATQKMLGFQSTQYEVDAVAVAPYFGQRYGQDPEVARVKPMTVAQFAGVIRSEEFPRVFASIAAQRAAITNPTMKLLAYEGGNSLVGFGAYGTDPQLNKLFDDLSRSEEMYKLNRDYLAGCSANGIELFMNFVNVSQPSRWGRWGALEYTGQVTSPKYRALMEAMT